MSDLRLSSARPWMVGLVGMLLGIFLVGYLIVMLGEGPTKLLHFGTDYPDPRVLDYGRSHFGPDLALVEGTWGHDGKWTFIMTMDPLLLNPADHAVLMDFPAYRAQRVLMPLFVSPLRVVGGPEAIAWGLAAANALAVGLGAWGTARLAKALGRSPWWGLLFAGNVGVWLEITITGTGVVASALAMWGIALATENRFTAAGIAFAGASLSRESMIVVAAGVGVWLFIRGRRRAAVRVIAPGAIALGLWWMYVWSVLDAPPFAGGHTTLGLPLVGPLTAIEQWLAQGGRSLVMGFGILGLSLVAVWQAWRRPAPLTWAGAGVAILGLSASSASWLFWYDPPRVMSLILVTVPLAVIARTPTRELVATEAAEATW